MMRWQTALAVAACVLAAAVLKPTTAAADCACEQGAICASGDGSLGTCSSLEPDSGYGCFYRSGCCCQVSAQVLRKTPILRPGDKGDAVVQLRDLLRKKGIDVPPQGAYDAELAKSVKKYQTQIGIKPSGTLDAPTAKALAK